MFDLSQLRDEKCWPPVVFRENAWYDNVHNVHNMTINTATRLRLHRASATGRRGNLRQLPGTWSIFATLHLKFAGCYVEQREGYIHETECAYHLRGPDQVPLWQRNCVSNSGGAHPFSIADVTNKRAPKLISTASWPNLTYSHQGVLSKDQSATSSPPDEYDEDIFPFNTRTIAYWISKSSTSRLSRKEFFSTTKGNDHAIYVRRQYALFCRRISLAATDI